MNVLCGSLSSFTQQIKIASEFLVKSIELFVDRPVMENHGVHLYVVLICREQLISWG